jgi:hypothetical protein
MLSATLALPPPLLVRGAVAAVWLYEGLWCKVLGHEPHQVRVVEAVPRLVSFLLFAWVAAAMSGAGS